MKLEINNILYNIIPSTDAILCKNPGSIIIQCDIKNISFWSWTHYNKIIWDTFPECADQLSKQEKIIIENIFLKMQKLKTFK